MVGKSKKLYPRDFKSNIGKKTDIKKIYLLPLTLTRSVILFVYVNDVET